MLKLPAFARWLVPGGFTLAVALTLLASAASTARTKNLPVPLGYWHGKGTFKPQDVTVGEGAGAVAVHLTSGSYDIYLFASPWEDPEVTGVLFLKLRGSGELSANGFTGTAQLGFRGQFDLDEDAGAPKGLFADGAYAMQGVVVVEIGGFQQDLPITQTIPASGHVSITKTSCTVINGELPSAIGGYPWSAKRSYVLPLRGGGC